MDKLIEKSIVKIDSVSPDFKRYLFDEIDWNYRLIGIRGARGTGKTTLLLQKLKLSYPGDPSVLYISLDDIYFSSNKMVDLIDRFVKNGGTRVFIDEVHKYRNWSQELKNMYDDHKELHVVFTSSSALEIDKGAFDLSRRAALYNLHELSLREYISIVHDLHVPVYSLEDILDNHTGVSKEINQLFRPLAHYNEFIRYGAYPFILEGKSQYFAMIDAIINQIIENDLQSITDIEYQTIIKIKKLLYITAGMVPFKPNIAELSRKIGTSRDLLVKYLYYLDSARLIQLLHRDTRGVSLLTKPEKIYLNNTTLMHTLNEENITTGTIRETFFMNQLSCKHKLTYPERGDFIVDEQYVFEVGGRNKTQKQIHGIEHAYIAADDIEYGFENKIPLWLFGFLY